MASTERTRAFEAYRDAIGTVMAARRHDGDAVAWLLTWRPALKDSTTDAFIAIICALMRELDRLGGDSEELVQRWAVNIADKQAGA